MASDKDTPVSPPKVVLVPMKLDAFILNKSACRGSAKISAIQRPDYKALRAESEFLEPEVLPPIDLFNASEENQRLYNAATGDYLPNRPGVYLHWVLPQCFRHGVTATEDAMEEHIEEKLRSGYFDKKPSKNDEQPTPEQQSLKMSFRACPNRFMIVRDMHFTVYAGAGDPPKRSTDCFIVSSDRIRYVGAIPYNEDLDVESSPFLDPEAPIERQAEVFLGMKQRAEDWSEDPYALRHTPLTIVDCSNPYFADYQPQNVGVFSIHDDMSYFSDGKIQRPRDSGGVSSTDVNYYVLGWHSDQDMDPFYLPPEIKDKKNLPKNGERLEDCFMKLAKEQNFTSWLEADVSGRTLCHGALYGVEFHHEEQGLASKANELQEALIKQHPVAIGGSGLDALFAWLNTKNGEDARNDTSEGVVQEVLALQRLLLSREEDPDSQATAEEQLSFDHFAAEEGEGHWHFATVSKQDVVESVPQSPVDSGEDVNIDNVPLTSNEPPLPSLTPPESEMYTPSVAILKKLESLNDKQKLFDAAVKEIRHLRWELFAEWWKAVTMSRNLNEAEPETTARRDAIRANVSRITNMLNSLIGLSHEHEDGSTLDLDCVSLEDLAKQVQDELSSLADETEVTKANVTLQRGAGDRFYLPKDPTALVGGVPSGWPVDFDEPVKVRLAEQVAVLGLNTQGQKLGPAASDSDEVNYFNYLNNFALEAHFEPYSSHYNDLKRELGAERAFHNMTFMIRNGYPHLRIAGPDEAQGYEYLMSNNKSERKLYPRTERSFPGYADRLSAKLPKQLQEAAKSLLRWEFPFFDHVDQWSKGIDIPVPPAYYRDGDRWVGQPLCPLFVEWEVEYHHIDFEHWEFVEGKDSLFRYSLKPDHKVSTLATSGDVRTISGRSMVTPEAQLSLQKSVKELLDTTPVDEATAPEEKKLLDQYRTEDGEVKLLKSLGVIDYFTIKLEGFREQLVTRLGETHIKPSILLDGKVTNPELLDRLSADFGIEKGHIEMMESSSETTPFASLNNIPLAPSQQGDDTNASVPCPFKPVTHGQFRFKKFNIVDKFGQVLTAPYPLYPCTSAEYSLNQLTERYGGNPNTVDGAPKNVENEYVQIPPSLNQPARWNSEWMLPEADGSWRPANEYENPIWGWLIVDYSDRSIQVFRPDGCFLFEIGLWIGGRKDITLRPGILPVSEVSSPFQSLEPVGVASETFKTISTGTPQLDEFIHHLLSSKEGELPALPFAIFSTVSQAMEDGSLGVPHDSLTDSLPVVMGRPLALVNMGWSLELSTTPYENESTIISKAPAEGKGLLDYSFPLKLGDGNNRHDGLVGFFKQAPALNHEVGSKFDFDHSKLYTYFVDEAEDGDPREAISPANFPHFKPFYEQPSGFASPERYRRARDSYLQVFSTLLDPFTPMNAYSGILPISPLKLPSWAVEKALRNLTASIRIGPTLLPIDLPPFRQDREPVVVSGDGGHDELAPVQTGRRDGLPIPAMPGGDWSWIQPYPVHEGGEEKKKKKKRENEGSDKDETGLLYNIYGICSSDVKPRLDPRSLLCVVEGVLELRQPIVNGGGPPAVASA